MLEFPDKIGLAVKEQTQYCSFIDVELPFNLDSYFLLFDQCLAMQAT